MSEWSRGGGLDTRKLHLSSSSKYWTGPFPGVKSPIEAWGGGTVYALLKQLI